MTTKARPLGPVSVCACLLIGCQGATPESAPLSASAALHGPAAASKKVVSQVQLAGQLGLGTTAVQLDARGRVSLARGTLGVLGADPLAFVRERIAPLGLTAGEGLVLLHEERATGGTRHLRIGRAIGGIPVAFDQIRIHAGADGVVYALEAETSPLETFAYRPPAFPPSEAVRRASGGFQGKFASPPATSLVIVGERLQGVKGSHLAYRVELAYPIRAGEVPRAEEVYVDARTGELLGRLSLVMTDNTTVTGNDLDGHSVTLQASRDASGTSLQDVVTVPGVTFALLNGANGDALYTSVTIDGDQAAFSAGKNVAQVLAFFADPAGLGFKRWDFNTSPVGTGGTVIAIPHTGTNMGNAYFSVMTANGTKYGVMSFGDGDGQLFRELERCLDVAGHEMGHGIVAANANLAYHNQSGALNESFADVFGWLTDPSNTQIGEDCLTSTYAGKGLRDMCDPGNPAVAFSTQPATMAEFQDLPDTDEGDHGGVHTNSGIPNHAACLYKQASSFTDLRRVWYQALSVHLGPTSDFRAMVEASMTSCGELGLGSCTALGNAWTQVGLAPAGGGGGSCPPNSTMQNGQCFCNPGYHVNAAGTGCEPDAATTCPAHAHAVGTDCYCDTGYTPDPTGQSCVPVNSGNACGAHSHVEGANCVCDSCYQPNGNESSACVAIPGCAMCTDPLSYSDGKGGCACIPGTAPTGGVCTPVPGSCGAESYTGRCVGDRLIYCDTNDPIQIKTIDCAANPTATTCAFGDNGFDCRVPASSCGSVPETGACVGTNAQVCSSGTIQSFDCTGYACRAYTYGGVAVHFCYPCPDHATWTDAANGDGTCNCDPGYMPSADKMSCVVASGGGVDAGTGGGGGGGGSGAKGGGGCSIGDGGSSTGFAGMLPALLGLLALRRRRRA